MKQIHTGVPNKTMSDLPFQGDLKLLLRVYAKIDGWGFDHGQSGFRNMQKLLKQPHKDDLIASLVPDFVQRLQALDGPNGFAIYKAILAKEKD